jgi:hemolysin D
MTGSATSTPAEPGAPALRHPALELLARYRAVGAAAWAARHDLAGPRRLAHETAFLPAALALQDTPVHPAPRRAMAVIVALLAAALGWSLWGEVDVVAVAPGRLMLSEGRQLVQPLETAVVRRIAVRDGDRVAAGQLLLELDPTAAQADHASLQAQAAAAAAERQRAQALLAALARSLRPPGAEPAVQAEWQDIAARRERLAADTRLREAETTTALRALDKVAALLPLARQREADTRALAGQGFVAGHALQDRSRDRIELEQEHATQQARVAEAQAALHEARQAQAAHDAEVRRQLQDRLLQAQQQQAQLQPQLDKGAHREGLTQLRAPVAGQVQELAVRSLGGVVTPAQTLMVIVPEAGPLHAEVMLENKDIGFVHPGQAAAVKLEAFPFTRYGTVEATVNSISADAVVGEDGVARFKALLTLAAGEVAVEGRAVRLGAGLNVTGEIKTGRRKLIRFLLDPVVAYRGEAWRER